MEYDVGLDVSLKLTEICIVDPTGKIDAREQFFRSGGVATFIKSHGPMSPGLGSRREQQRRGFGRS